MRHAGAAAVLGILTGSGIACREEVLELELVFGAGMQISDGLKCALDDDTLLVGEVLAGARPACLVVDVVPTDGQPGCRLSELLQWCSSHDCEPDADLRVRIDLTEPIAETMGLKDLLDALSGTVLFDDAPSTIAILRATVVGLPCDEVDDGPRFACSDVLGCVYSCPVALESFEGQLVLDLDKLPRPPGSPDDCVLSVRTCASDRMFDRDMLLDMSPCDTDPNAP